MDELKYNSKFKSEDILEYISDILSHIIYNKYNITIEKTKIYTTLSFSNDTTRADVSSKIAFLLSRQLSENPKIIAEELKEEFLNEEFQDGKLESKSGMFSKIKTMGPYLNIFLDSQYLTNILLAMVNKTSTIFKGLQSESPSKSNDKKNADILNQKFDFIFEYPSVNPNKPWHLGHLRNALIGDTLSNMVEERGFSVLRLDYIDNLGLQVAQTLWWILKNHLENKTYQKYDLWLGNIYVDAATALENPKNEKEARIILKDLEDGANDVSKLGRSVVEKCVHAQYETAYKFGINHNLLFFESNVVNYLLSEGLSLLKSNKNVYRSTDGPNKDCLVIKISDKIKKNFGDLKSDEKILIRSDGTLTYTGKDIIFHMWKAGILKKSINLEVFDDTNRIPTYMSSSNGTKFTLTTSDKAYLVNIIGSEQSFPQAIVSDILHNLSDGKINLFHIAYEHVKLSDGKFSGRKGTWKGYTTDQFITELMNKIKKAFYSDKSMDKNAFNIAIGAIRYSFLKISSSKTITFSWESALNTKGDSGPYLQYALVRAKSIIRKIGNSEMKKHLHSTVANSYVPSDQERKLVLVILKTKYVVKKPNVTPENMDNYFDIVSLCDQTYTLALEFNKFYATHKVMGANTEGAKYFRIILLNSFIVSMNYMFRILGIPELDVM